MNVRTSLAILPLTHPQSATEWLTSTDAVSYEQALRVMDARAANISAGKASELVWLLEHPPLFTAGTGARGEDLTGTDRFPIHTTGRGGKLTYHGPGQRVAYTMIDLKRRGADVRRYVVTLEEWIIRTLAIFGIDGERRSDRVGVWVARPDKGKGYEDKVAALGIRVKRWVTLHGISLNVSPDLSHYAGILPCGISEQKWGVTSLHDLGVKVSINELDVALKKTFEELFGRALEVSDSPREFHLSPRSQERAAPN